MKQSLSSLQIDVARKLAALMHGGRWRVGDRISDLHLADELKVSRTPVRQALMLLTAQGLVAYHPGRGFRVERVPDGDDALEQLVPPSEAEALYSQIMNHRASGQLAGEVSEAQLVELFGVTRGAVRRVLMRFAAEGLTERLPGHGWRFTESLDNPQAVHESYDFRLIVECGALKMAGFAPDPEQLQQLFREQSDILQMPVEQLRQDVWFKANANFHETLVSWSRNRFLIESVRRQNSLRKISEFAHFSHLSEQHIRQACTDHLGILKALKEGDADYAAALLRRHISRSAEI
ncbi:MAG: GntR family transcriptional regulator [Comamonas sp.]|nr:GntR family transcriptional regulator [Comamonas sp.]